MVFIPSFEPVGTEESVKHSERMVNKKQRQVMIMTFRCNKLQEDTHVTLKGKWKAMDILMQRLLCEEASGEMSMGSERFLSLYSSDGFVLTFQDVVCSTCEFLLLVRWT